MATPPNRVPVRVARGTKAALTAGLADLKEGEICYATDENGLYVVEGGVLTQAGADLASTSVDALGDVDTTSVAPTDGQILTWVDANSQWEPANASSAVTQINDLTDVDTATTAPTGGQVLTWVNANSAWEPVPSVSGPVKLSELTDTTTTAFTLTEDFNSRWDTATSTFPTSSNEWWLQLSGEGRLWVNKTDGTSTDQTTNLNAVQVGDAYQVATDAGFATLLSEGTVTAITNNIGANNTYGFNADGLYGDVNTHTGPIYLRFGTYSSTVTDGAALTWDSTTLKWIEGQAPLNTLYPLDCSAADAKVVFVLHGDETNGTTSLTDPVNGIQFFGVNTAATTTSISKFGAGCLNTTLSRYFEESNSDARTILEDKDWGIDFWYNRDSGDTSTQDEIFCSHASSKFSNVSWHWIYRPLTPDLQFVYTTNGSTQITTEFALGAALTQDTWHHISISREGTTLRAFVNGVQVDTDKTIANDSFYVYNSWGMAIGGARGGTTPCRGYIDEFRMKVGAPGYTAAFTPPAAPYADTTSECLPGAPGNGQILEYSSADSSWLSVDYISKATLQAEVAASTDFTDFQARIAAL